MMGGEPEPGWRMAQAARAGTVEAVEGGRFVDDYLLYLLARASHAASAEFHALLAGRGVPVPVWRVLASLSGAGAMTVGELARTVLSKQPTLTKVVDRLQASGLVARSGTANDRRQVLVSLTPAGARLVADLLDAAKAHEAALLRQLPPGEVASLKAALRRLIAALDAPGGP
jgi:MarR family transcriptional regulator, organic hydroperoxide resistance regulator